MRLVVVLVVAFVGIACASAEARDDGASLSLYEAAQLGYSARVKALLDEGTDANAPRNDSKHMARSAATPPACP